MTMSFRLRLLRRGFLAGLLTLLPMSAFAEPTPLTIRVLARNAKFVGSSMGGAKVWVRDAQTGEILAQGVTSGGTGNTGRLVGPRVRGNRISSDEDASFNAVLDLDEPRLITVEAAGPIAQPQALGRVSSTQWVLPGKGVSGGDGWLLELSGFVVDILSPAAHSDADGESVDIVANVVLPCGCPVTPGGTWNADDYEIVAQLLRDGQILQREPMAYSGQSSRFITSLRPPGPGAYQVLVTAYDAQTGNTGLDRTSFFGNRIWLSSQVSTRHRPNSAFFHSREAFIASASSNCEAS